MAGPEEAWQDFGQRVDLTARIREILLNYPEGSTILKEIVQVHRGDCCSPLPAHGATQTRGGQQLGAPTEFALRTQCRAYKAFNQAQLHSTPA